MAEDAADDSAEDGIGDEVEDTPVAVVAVVTESGGRVEDGEPMGPNAADEAAMLGDDDLPAVVPPPARAPGAAGPLPSLDSLVSRIPAPTRSALDEQLRARFVRVRKLKPGELK